MLRSAFIGAIASFLLAAGPARAEWRSTIVGARPMLPAHFVAFESPTGAASITPGARVARPEDLPETDSPIAWVAPLVDRHLGAAERTADIAPELLEAITRIEPIYDQTRLEGPQSPVKMSVSPGTATMDNVFADHWSRADVDPNVSRRVPFIAMAWQARDRLPCDAFLKNRPRAGYEQPALTALTRTDCEALARTQAMDFEAAARPVPIVPGWIAVPVFAAPMPGSRLSSEAFWAQRRLEIARVEAELRVRQNWHGGMQGIRRTVARR